MWMLSASPDEWRVEWGVVLDKNGIPISEEERLTIIETVKWLPANVDSIVDDYTKMIIEHPVSIIRWETGAGKTTQVPKNIRFATGLNISVTQPRVISAVSNSRRISKELLAELGDKKYTIWYNEIWYRTGVDVSAKRKAMLSFNTGGLEMMRQFVSNLVPDILFLDEAHHFSLDTEVLMWLFKTRADINKKLVIMSATIDPTIFQDYFSYYRSNYISGLF